MERQKVLVPSASVRFSILLPYSSLKGALWTPVSQSWIAAVVVKNTDHFLNTALMSADFETISTAGYTFHPDFPFLNFLRLIYQGRRV